MSEIVCSHQELGTNAQCCQYKEETTSNFQNSQNTQKTWTYKPHSALARALIEKQLSDDQIESMDKNQWYEVRLEEIPNEIATKFVKMSIDTDTDKFLKKSIEKSDWIFTQLWHSFAKAILSWFMTQTSINGLLGRGSMFVLSFEQFLKLLGVNSDWRKDSFLDLGAGDGEVTKHLAPAFSQIYVTEVSTTMQKLLTKRGYQCLGINEWDKTKKYDVISCLNLLDRCDTPLTLLKQIKNSLNKDGYLIVALVLPFSQYVESGRADHKPTEQLPITGSTFEHQMASAVLNMFEPMGFHLVSWTRVPYLCEGDLRQCYYWLDDAIFVLQVKD